MGVTRTRSWSVPSGCLGRRSNENEGKEDDRV